MKKYLLILLLATMGLSVKAQQDTTNKQKEEYCMVLAQSRLFSTKVTVIVDFGQETIFSNTLMQELKTNRERS